MNAHIQFGRSIKPTQVKDVYKAGVSILYDRMSEKAVSANITVGTEPWVIKAFGLGEGEEVVVNNVFGTIREPLNYNGEAIKLTNDNNTIFLALAGIYNLETDVVLGNLVCIAYPLSAMEEKEKRTVALTNPNGPQKNRPNIILNNTEYSVDFYVGSTPTVIRAYGLTDQTIQLLSFFEDSEEQVIEDGDPVEIDADNTSLLVHIAGGYRLKLVGDPSGVFVVLNPTVVNYNDPFLKTGPAGPQGPPGPAGGGGAGYLHTQTIADTTWIINHNLGYKPSVELIDSGGNEFDAEVTHISDNQVNVYLVAPLAGIARLN